MIKSVFLLFGILFFPSLIYAQLFPYNPREWNTNWTYTKFSDSFSGTLLDTSKWEVVKNYGKVKCVFVDSVGTTYSVNNGLNLSMIYHPGYCYNENGNIFCPDYISAEIVSKEKFKYGIYEGRMKFATDEGSWPAFWFYGGSGAEDPQYNTGYASEIDIAEYNWHKKDWPSSGYYVNTDHVFHWWWPQSIHGTREMEDILGGIKNNSVNWSASHTFKLIYTPYDVTFYIDGALNWRRSRFYTVIGIVPVDIFPVDINESTQYLENEWFPKHEGSIILSQQVAGNVDNNDISAPQTSLFEWVTYKQFFLAPEITVNNTSCLTSTSTIDVDPMATNITWQVTPSNLVTISSGNGSIANITAVPSASGEATITYTFSMPSGETFSAEKEFWVGIPPTPTRIIGFASTGQEFGSNTYYDFIVPANPLAVTNYHWDVDGGTIVSGQGTYTINVLTGTVINNDIDFAVDIRLENDCGLTSQFARTGWVISGSGGAQIIISPNPATSETTIELIPGDGQVLPVDATWDLEIYDWMQSLKTKTQKGKGNKRSVNTTGWKEGVYLVRVKIGDETISGKLLVKP